MPIVFVANVRAVLYHTLKFPSIVPLSSNFLLRQTPMRAQYVVVVVLWWMVEHSHSPVRSALTTTTTKDGRSKENTEMLQTWCTSKNEKFLRRLVLRSWKTTSVVPSILVSIFKPPPWHWYHLQVCVCERVWVCTRMAEIVWNVKKEKKKTIGILHSSLWRTRVSVSVCTWHF